MQLLLALSLSFLAAGSEDDTFQKLIDLGYRVRVDQKITDSRQVILENQGLPSVSANVRVNTSRQIEVRDEDVNGAFSLQRALPFDPIGTDCAVYTRDSTYFIIANSREDRLQVRSWDIGNEGTFQERHPLLVEAMWTTARRLLSSRASGRLGPTKKRVFNGVELDSAVSEDQREFVDVLTYAKAKSWTSQGLEDAWVFKRGDSTLRLALGAAKVKTGEQWVPISDVTLRHRGFVFAPVEVLSRLD